MTEPQETTMPDGPEKAHGDALQDVLDAEPEQDDAGDEQSG